MIRWHSKPLRRSVKNRSNTFLLSLKGIRHEIENGYKEFLVIDQKNLGLLQHIFILFWYHFNIWVLKKDALAASHLKVTLQTISDSRRLFSPRCCTYNCSKGMILPKWKTRGLCQLLDNCRHCLKLSSIRTVVSACFFYQIVGVILAYRWRALNRNVVSNRRVE